MNPATAPDCNYQIFPADDHGRRVHWEGPLENVRPAEDVERLMGELYQADALRQVVDHIELDLFHCTTINTRGIAFLIYLGRRLDAHGASWCVVNAPVILNRMLQMLGLCDAFDIHTASVDPDYSPRADDPHDGDAFSASQTALPHSEPKQD